MADTYRLVLDENLEREVAERLDEAGHDVEHVDSVDELGEGAHDTDLAAYSVETDRAIVTYDDDFVEQMRSEPPVSPNRTPLPNTSVGTLLQR